MTTDPTTSRPLHVLAIAGSLRKASYNHRLICAAVDLAPTDLEVEVCDALGHLPHFDEDLETAGSPGPVQRFQERVRAADGLLVATPEYNHSLPGVLKNGLDWLSRPYGDGSLLGKPVAIVGASTGPWGTRLAQKELRAVLASTESRVLPSPPLYLARAAEAFDAEGQLIDERVAANLRRVLDGLASWIRYQERGATSV